MNYNFYVGDYAETKDGEIGYITGVKFSGEDKRWCSIRATCRQNDSIISFEGYEDSVSDRFNRIGRYDFTEERNKPKDKIKPLKVSYINDCFQDMVDKINELVSAVNELREKVNGN